MPDSPTPHDHPFQALLEDPYTAEVLLREQLPAEVAERPPPLRPCLAHRAHKPPARLLLTQWPGMERAGRFRVLA